MFSAKKSERKVDPMNHSEKSTKMYSINHRAEVLLQKRIQSLNREEKEVVCAFTVDQRIVSTRFRNRIIRSNEVAKRHEKILSRFQHRHERYHHETMKLKASKTNIIDKSTTSNQHRREIMLNLKATNFGKISDSKISPISNDKSGNSKSLNDGKGILQIFRRSDHLHGRPQTALEVKNKQWHKRAKSANERLVRAKSAPLHSWRNSPEILRALNIQTGGFYQANKVKRPLSRKNFFEIFDIEEFKRFREIETVRQKDKTKSFLNSVEPVILVPWEPGLPKDSKPEPNLDEKPTREKFSAFLSRTESTPLLNFKKESRQ